MGTLWLKNWKKTHVFACDCAFSSHRIKCNTSTESFLWRASFLLPTLMSYEQYMRTLWPRSMKIWWFNRALCSLIHLLCFKRLIFETIIIIIIVHLYWKALKPSQRCSKALCKGASMTFQKDGSLVLSWNEAMYPVHEWLVAACSSSKCLHSWMTDLRM